MDNSNVGISPENTNEQIIENAAPAANTENAASAAAPANVENAAVQAPVNVEAVSPAAPINVESTSVPETTANAESIVSPAVAAVNTENAVSPAVAASTDNVTAAETPVNAESASAPAEASAQAETVAAEAEKPLTRKEKKQLKKAKKKEKKLQKKLAKKERKKRWKETKKEDRRKLKEHYKDAPWFIRIPRLLVAPLIKISMIGAVVVVILSILGGCVFLGVAGYYLSLIDNENAPVDPERIEEISPRDAEGAARIAAMDKVDPNDTWTICVYMIGADLEDWDENDLSITTCYSIKKERTERNEEAIEKDFAALEKYTDELKENNLPLPEFLFYPDKPTASYTEYVTNEVVVASADGCASTDISEMFSAEVPENVKIVVQTGGATRWSNTFINPNKTQRFEISDGEFKEVSNEPLQRAGDPNTLADFLRYCDDNYESDHKILILWDHGSGPFGYGNDSIFGGDPMSIKEIREALSMVYTPNEEDPEFDIIGFDACLMSSLEVTHALNGFGAYYALSEETEPADGWDYIGWLEKWKEDPSMGPAAVAQAIADSYTDYYMTQNVNIGKIFSMREVTFAVLDAKKAEELYDAYGELTKRQLIDSASDISVLAEIGRCCDKSTHVLADAYNILNLVDLGNYVDYMADTYPEECTKIDNLLKETVLYRRQNGSLCDSEGISVYIPGSIDSYSGLAYFLRYEYDVCENDYTRALYYYKMSGCMNEEMLETLKPLTDEVPTVLDISLFDKFEKIDPVIKDDTFIVPIDENLQKMIQRYSFTLAAYDETFGEITYYGEDEYLYPDGDGNLVNDFDGEWVCLDGEPLAIEFTSATASAVEYRSKVLYNGVESYLIFSYNRDTEEFAIKGIREIPSNQVDGINYLVNTKANKELQHNDEITPLYETTDAYGQNGQKQGKTIKYRVTSNISMKELDSGYYLAMASISDQRGDGYSSKVIGYRVSGGKIKECEINEDFVGTEY